MTTELEKRDENGRFVNSPGPGRPKKGTAIRDLLKNVPIAKKRELVEIAYRCAIENADYHWAEWIAKHSGESGANEKGGDTFIQNAVLVRYIEGG